MQVLQLWYVVEGFIHTSGHLIHGLQNTIPLHTVSFRWPI